MNQNKHNIEIERKYLVVGDFKKFASSSIDIVQAYLASDKERTIRIRLAGDQAFITIKGEPDGIRRFEWESKIDFIDATELMNLALTTPIRKTRYIVPYGKWTIEVDEFQGKNLGLILAEIELDSEDDIPEIPAWIGKEVSDDKRYQNSELSQNPFSSWPENK